MTRGLAGQNAAEHVMIDVPAGQHQPDLLSVLCALKEPDNLPSGERRIHSTADCRKGNCRRGMASWTTFAYHSELD
jgi:hypothetical protein